MTHAVLPPAPEPSRAWWAEARPMLIVALLVLAVWAACFHFPFVWDALGIGESDKPFLDLYGLLAADDAARAGANPFQPNSFDPYHRPLVYTEWWLATGKLGLTRADTIWLGWTLAGATLLTAIVMVRPRGRSECVAFFLWFVSPAMLMAIDRANNDLVIFILMSAGLAAMRRSATPWRAFAVVAFAVAAVLKYYPLAGSIMLLEARTRRELVGGIAIYLIVLGFAWPALEAGLVSAVRFMPKPIWLYAFGAPMLFRDFGFESAAGWLALAAVVGAWAAWSASRHAPEPTGGDANRACEREFIVGAALVVGCFFLGASYLYKFVFTAWLLPWLWRGKGVERRWWWTLRILLVSVLWLEGIMALVMNVFAAPFSRRFAEGLLAPTLFVSQMLSWALVACLLRFLMVYAIQHARVFVRTTP